MASSMLSASISGGRPLQGRDCLSTKSSFNGKTLLLTLRGKPYQQKTKRSLSVRAKNNADKPGHVGDFMAGFLVGGAIFGVVGYLFAPQIRKSLLNENEHGFQKATRPIYNYYDDGPETARQKLSEKVKQLDSVIENIMTWFRGGKKAPPIPVEVETDESVK